MKKMPASGVKRAMLLLEIVVLATVVVACQPHPETLDGGTRVDGPFLDSGHATEDATADVAAPDRATTPIPCDYADQASCAAHTECRWLETSCEVVPTSSCGTLDWTQCTTTAGCHWFYRDGTGHLPDDPDCTCDPLDLDCSCALTCDPHAHWNTAGDACLDSAELPVSGLCCAVMTSFCTADRPCPEYETPKRCGNDLRCVFVPTNDQYMPGYCAYRPDAG